MMDFFDFIVNMVGTLATSFLSFTISGELFTYGHLIVAVSVLGVLIRLLLVRIKGGRL